MKVIFCVIFLSTQCVSIYSLLIKQFLDDFVDQQLYFELREYFNTTRKDCVWREPVRHRHLCPKEVMIELFSNGQREMIDTTDKNWLTNSSVWDREKENVFIIHGYAGGDNSAPKLLLQDAFIQNGRYNAFVLEYGPVSRAPCFVQVVYNIKYVSACIASYIKTFQRSGMPANSITCIGHSIGAHICGQLKKHLQFRLKKIIGMDPALPLIRESDRLSYRDAESVHTIQTNAGFYGDLGSIGHVDVCANNGNIQPFCVGELNANLCSHLWSLCFTAQSLFSDYRMYAKKCTKVCPHLSVFQFANIFTQLDRRNGASFDSNNATDDQPEIISWGIDIPKSIRGSYCLTSIVPPFCPKYLNGFGDERCCSLINMFS